jgi:hypothetical protein
VLSRVTVVTTSSLEKAFKEAEASLQLEGLDVTSNARYQDLKKRLLRGELTFDDVRGEILKFFAKEGPA